jgi:glycosyltransferase involved in cell wall biosynthesis
MSQKPVKIIAGMPAYNEAKYIGTLVLNTRQYVDEVIVIDDGSTDETASVASLAGAKVVKHPRNQGYGASILSIFDEAKKRDPDVLVILDADSQHDPRNIPDVIKPVLDGFDMVIGSREKQAASIPFYRRIGQKIISRSVNVLSPNNVVDSESGFRAFSRKAIATLDLKENGMAISAETVAEAARQNLKISQVPISISYSKDSSTLNPVAHGLGVFSRVLVMISEQKPLFFFGLAGLILMLAGLAAGLFAFHLYSGTRVLSTGWSVLAIFLVILGVMSVFNGLTLHAMYSIIHQAITKNRR